MSGLLDQLYKTKLRLAGLVAAVIGVGLLFVAKQAAGVPVLHWLVQWPTSEVGAILLSGGLFGVIFEYYARQEADARTDEHLRRAIQHEAPAICDAVLDSFAFNADALKNIASDDTLDWIATNAMGLRLHDQQLASDLYADLRDQVIRAPERWHDVAITISLSPWVSGPATGSGSMFTATIRWEYRVAPTSATMRFACVSELDEYRELLRDQSVTSAWYFGKPAGLDATSPDAYELSQLTVNGKPRTIRRTERRGAQLYSVSLGATASSGEEVTIAYTYRVLVQRHGHLLYLDFPRPAKGLHVTLDYEGAGIRRVNVLDFIASSEASRVEHAPATTPARTIDVGFDGWVFPRSGVAFVWVLEEEVAATTSTSDAQAGPPRS